jgi:hypothetical protein
MNRPRSLSITVQWLAVVSSGVLVVMMLLTLATGVAQEPFESVHAVDLYRASLLRAGPTLQVILAADALFIGLMPRFSSPSRGPRRAATQ